MAKQLGVHANFALNFPKLLFIGWCLLILNHGSITSACTIGSFNLTALQMWGTWETRVTLGDVPSTFLLNLCETVQPAVSAGACSTSVSSCLKQGEVFTNIGSHNDTLQLTVNEDSGGFRLDYVCADCTGTDVMQTSIDFKCGTTLGSPVFLEKTGVAYIFEWYTTVACKTVKDPALSEVPCSIFDSNNLKHDLSPLIKLKGGYLVESPDADSLYINVCRDITREDSGPTGGCPAGAGACLVRGGPGQGEGGGQVAGVAIGQPHRKLERLSDQEVKLHYEGSTTALDSCGDFKPTVTMVFLCPQGNGRFGGSRGPILLSSTNCQYQVQWETEYACHVDMLTTASCAFNSQTHGIDFDLSPLRKPNGQFYNVDNDPVYVYYINVCADLTMPEACSGFASCQVDKNGENAVGAGHNQSHELRYSDGELTLIYKQGQTCPHNKFQRTSVISFKCNKTQGIGSPVYVTETECTYFFQWDTSHACLADTPAQGSCRLAHGTQRYDLAPLVRQKGPNWLVLDGRHDHEGMVEYFINVCGAVVGGDPATEGCPSDSAACVVATSGAVKTATSLGKFASPPSLLNGHLTMTYSEGAVCTGGQRQTHITFICSPGDLESAPILVRKSSDNCTYDLEWHTAAACPLASKWGTDCKVFDDDAGVSFDLNPLKREKGHYNVTFGDYDYFINVCTDIWGSPCSQASPSASPGNPAACQARRDGSGESYILGTTNTSLGYFDGIIKLTYLGGTPYRSTHGPGQPRMTEIAFLCDPNADVGTPQYFQENNATYFFRWYTKHACPEQPVECVVTDEARKEQYDLSSLSKALEEENWSFVDDKNPADRKKYYINVCRPVNPYLTCGAFAGACQTSFGDKETVSIENLGVPSAPPSIESSGHLLLTYVNGSQCGETRMTSHIHFTCNKGTLASTPRLLEVVDACTYSFIWETEAACPIDVSEGENCTVRDLNSDYVFNLQPLMKTRADDSCYQVFGPDNKVYKLNICGGVPSCPDGPGACLASDTPASSLGVATTTPIFSDEGLLTLEYLNGKFDSSTAGHMSTVISFLCRRNASQTNPSLVFVRQEGLRYIFSMDTPLACLPESVDCLVSDSHGNQYDLSPLAKDAGNWEAVDTRPGHSGLSYHINVCRPINKGAPDTATCRGGPIGACQTDSATSKAFNLGYVQAMPEAATDGSLSLRYVNGDVCHGQYHRSTRINFECSDTPGSPVFQAETGECEYVFSWETPAACKLQRETGGNCSVQVPEFGFQFNLSSLYTPQDYSISTPEHNYTINVCGPLHSPMGECATTSNVGGCQRVTDGTYKNAGLFNKNLTYSSGVLMLNYTQGSTCHSVYQRSTAINFYCDENVQGSGAPHYIRETSDCTYLFEWATPLACPPFKVVECSYRDGTSQYDLAPLAKLTDNYRVHGGGNSLNGDSYVINVCRSLWHRHGAQGEFCPSNSAACLQTTDSSGNTRYISIGEVTTGPTMSNGHLVLTYRNGDACPDGTGRKRSTVINIQCDQNSVGTSPYLDHVDADCEYHFVWMTNYACDIKEKTDKPAGDCTATNPVSGFRFDLSTLTLSEGYPVMGSDSHKYVLNVCAALSSTVCSGTNIGSCQEELAVDGRHFNAGLFNKNLYFDDSILFLSYDNGKPCHNHAYNRSSVINFVCPHQKDTIGAPVFIAESDDCTYYFSWHTSLACEKFIQCSVVNGSETINLAPLINDQGYHISASLIDGDDSVTYINLCRPLNPIPGLTCHPSAAACQVKDGQPMSLGRVSEGPKIGSDGRLTITYTQGDRCPDDASKNLSSIISFFCKQGVTQGSPTLEGSENCVYRFTWGTNVICPQTAPEHDQDCTFFNTALQYRFDFTALSMQDHTVGSSSVNTMDLRLCGLASDQGEGCEGTAICLNDRGNKYSLGKLSSQKISQVGEMIKVDYTDGSSCPSSAVKKRQSSVLLVCDRNAVDTSPTLFSSDLSCHYSFRWLTSAACAPETRPCDIAYQGHVYDLQPLSQITGSFQISDSNKNKYYVNLCQPAYNTPAGCPAQASVCREKPDGLVDVLGMVYTQQLIPTGDTPDIEVRFTEGSAVKDCNPSSSGITHASTNITFQCSNKIGSPVFMGTKLVDERCEFQFLWESKVACKEERMAVEMKDMKITDPETNNVIDFTSIIQHGTWRAEGDSREEAAGDPSTYVYHINMGSDQTDIDGDNVHRCRDAAVCQTKVNDATFFRDIGTMTSRKYFIQDEVVEMEVTKAQSCGKDNADDVITTVIFQCETNVQVGTPEFSFESSNCQYHFLWLTSAVCIDGEVAIPDDEGENGSVVLAKHKKASITIAILLVIILLCILAIVLHKKERRYALYWRVRSCCPGSYSKVPSYSYSQLSNGDTEMSESGDSSSRSLFGFGGQEDEELLKETRRNPFEFHDDSDDEILPQV